MYWLFLSSFLNMKHCHLHEKLRTNFHFTTSLSVREEERDEDDNNEEQEEEMTWPGLC